MKLTPAHKAITALIIANTIWGAAPAIFKLSLENIPPFTLAFWRFFLGSLVMIPILKGQIWFKLKSISDLVLLFFNSLSGITVNILFFFLGLNLTKSINAAVIASSAPIMTFAIAILLLRERFVAKKCTGMLLGFLGILIIILEPILTKGLDGSVLGNIFFVLATLGAVGGTISGRSLFQKYNPLVLSFWCFVIGAFTFLPLAVNEYIKIPTLYTILDWRGYLGIFFGSLLSTAAAYSLFNWGLSKIRASDASLFTYIDPVVGALLGVAILHEPVSLFFLTGGALIFIGIFIAEGRIHYHPIHLFGKAYHLDGSSHTIKRKKKK
ncbi:DMT family transporter [Candidatus Gottesmanbacteria bacterium]|nr:DMT family transporter [Candidatus Gottesmanbacteria bacterium]